jgi:glycosyltransferase involved in cell wall biosynthesis
VAAIISSLDISVLSSTSEGLSNVILESMAAGKPVVATDVGGNSEMVMDGMTGYLIPPANSDAMANAIINLLKNSDKAKAMGSEGKKVVLAKFTVEAMVKCYENLYRSLMFNRQ